MRWRLGDLRDADACWANGARTRLLADGSLRIAPGATVEDLERAAWLPRPTSAHGVPPAFHQATLSELAWSYALRARGELLPARYRTARIHFRHPPQVPRRLLREEHLLAMRELAARPPAFGELQARTRLGAAQLVRMLSALHLAGSITTEGGDASTPLPRPAAIASPRRAQVRA